LRINQNVFNFKEKSITGDQQASHNTHVCRTQTGSGGNDCFWLPSGHQPTTEDRGKYPL